MKQNRSFAVLAFFVILGVGAALAYARYRVTANLEAVGIGVGAFILALVVASAIQVADQWDRAVILRLGHFHSLRGPGLFFIIPVIDAIPYWIDNLGWREYFIAIPEELHPVSREIQPLSVYLGALGMMGMTAWVGLNLAEVKAGDIIFISGAAGAVGSVAGQLAKLRGCRVIGSAGSMEKVMFLREECGFDIAFDYKIGPVLEQLKVEAPDGIDVYFDNVGGETLEAALSALRMHGRIIACGSISNYNAEKPRPGPSNLFNMITKRLTMKGLLVRDWLDRQDEFENEVGGYFKTGKLKSKETVVKGIEQAVGAFLGLFQGRNVGKMVVELALSRAVS